MRVMVFVKATDESEKISPSPDWSNEMMAAMGRFNDELRDAGVLRMAEGITHPAQGKRIAMDGADRTVLDGHSTETPETVVGFWLWEVKDLDEAVAWGKRCPNPMPTPSEIEIRPLHEMGDSE